MRNLFFFVTTHCNSRCKHCFYWKSLHKTKNLTLKQIEDIFSKFHNIHAIVLSGGEPFIRQDLDEVIKILVKYTDAQFIFIPTNCLVDITDRFEKILKENSHVSFVLCASLDGLENEHDYIRGVPGGFKKTVDLIKKLAVLKKSYPNFKQIVVNTVITNKNYDNLEKFMKFVRKLPVTFQAFDIIRGDHQKMIGPPTVGKLKKINRLRYKANKNHTKKFSFFRRLHQNMKVKEFIRNQNRILDGKPWPFPCMAGTTDFVIESDGSARICELQPKIGSLLKNRPEDLLQTKEAKEIFKKIKNHECDCTHTCITGSSMERSLKNIFWTRVWGFLKPLPKK